MNAALVIDAIVRQTTVLIATLATAAGQRAPLAHVADQVFADLVRELKEQGVANKVIADMFGMALRTYHTRVARLSGSGTDQGRSLWEAVLGFIQENGTVQRVDVLTRFAKDDDATVRGVLRDLVESELVFQTGRGDGTSYRARETTDLLPTARDGRLLDDLVLVGVHRHGPIAGADLAALVPGVEGAVLDDALERLVREGTITRTTTGDVVRYDSDTCVIPFGDSVGWEAAVLDHYQAMVSAFVTKLRLGKRRADLSDKVGGSTFVFDLWRGHPLAEECAGYLRSMREQGMALRKRLEEHNLATANPPGAAAFKVIAYVGQTVREDEEPTEE